jgi:hypothetical protein
LWLLSRDETQREVCVIAFFIPGQAKYQLDRVKVFCYYILYDSNRTSKKEEEKDIFCKMASRLQ